LRDFLSVPAQREVAANLADPDVIAGEIADALRSAAAGFEGLENASGGDAPPA
jgi:hypothetical protein